MAHTFKSHVCAIHETRYKCDNPESCDEKYTTVCREEHDRVMLMNYVQRKQCEMNQAIRDAERDARDAYSEGHWTGRQEVKDMI